MEKHCGGLAAWVLSAGLTCLLLTGCATVTTTNGSAEKRQCASGDGEACLEDSSQLTEDLQDERGMPGLREYYRIACRLGHLTSCLKCNKVACTLNEGEAYSLAAHLHYEGKGVREDPQRAMTYAERACSLGEGDGCNLLGVMHNSGKGMARKPNKARRYYRQACNMGVALGCANLGRSYADSQDGTPDYAQAREYLAQACELGDGGGCALLARHGL